MDELAASLVALEAVLGSREAAWERVLDTVAATRGLVAPHPDDALPELAPWRAPDAHLLLARVHEASVAGRRGSGTFYTPPALVAWLMEGALDVAEGIPRVLDPACGCGAFLVPVALRVAERLGVPVAEVLPHVHGTDLDPVAVAVTRLLLRIEAPDVDPLLLTRTVQVADGLDGHPGSPYDIVLGNPPFLGQLRRRTARGAHQDRSGYADTSALFLRHALSLVQPGGTVALVQPLSVLAARDAAPVRAAVADAGAVTAFWSSTEPVFPGAAVRTCAVVVELGTDQGPVRTWHGREFTRGHDVALPPGEWGPLAARAAGVPTVVLREGTPGTPDAHGTLGDLGPCTADFRDQYYGLVPFVGEDADLPAARPRARLVTSGLIEPAECRWGSTPTRFAKRSWAAPVVDLDALHLDGALSGWATARLVPKVLVATQGRVLEAVVDVDGDWLPSVPVLTVVPPPERLWHVLAVLLSPVVVAHAAARYLGTALSTAAVKLSASQVAALALPGDPVAWDDGAAAARVAQTGPASGRREALLACARAMGAAYGGDSAEALAWWTSRLRPETTCAPDPSPLTMREP